MNGGLIPFALVAVTTGLMLGLVRTRLALLGASLFVAATFLGWTLPAVTAETTLFVALFVALLVTGIAIYLPALRSRPWILAMGLNGGLWLGACAAAVRLPAGLAMIALTPIAIALARWTVQRDLIIIAKVAASWMIAIASLTLFVSLLSTPGYQPDHME